MQGIYRFLDNVKLLPQEGPEFESQAAVASPCVYGVSSGCSSFLPQSKKLGELQNKLPIDK